MIKVHLRAGEHSLLAKLPEERYPELVELGGQDRDRRWDAPDVQVLRD